jgi:hypothetical protein
MRQQRGVVSAHDQAFGGLEPVQTRLGEVRAHHLGGAVGRSVIDDEDLYAAQLCGRGRKRPPQLLAAVHRHDRDGRIDHDGRATA